MIGAARAALADALTGLGIPIHTYPTGSVTPPCITITWGSPLIEPTTTLRDLIGLEAHLTATAAAGASSHERLDALVDAAIPMLLAAGIRVEPVPAPTSDDNGRTHTAVIPVLIGTLRSS